MNMGPSQVLKDLKPVCLVFPKCGNEEGLEIHQDSDDSYQPSPRLQRSLVWGIRGRRIGTRSLPRVAQHSENPVSRGDKIQGPESV